LTLSGLTVLTRTYKPWIGNSPINSLPNNLSAYTVRIGRYSYSIDWRFHSVDRR